MFFFTFQKSGAHIQVIISSKTNTEYLPLTITEHHLLLIFLKHGFPERVRLVCREGMGGQLYRDTLDFLINITYTLQWMFSTYPFLSSAFTDCQ